MVSSEFNFFQIGDFFPHSFKSVGIQLQKGHWNKILQYVFNIYELLFITVRVILITFIWSPLTISDLVSQWWNYLDQSGSTFSLLILYYFIIDTLFSECVFFWAYHLLFIPSSCLLILTLNYYSFEYMCHNLSHSTVGLWQILWYSLNFAFLLLSPSAIYMTCFFLTSAVAETSHGIPLSCFQLNMEPTFCCHMMLWPLQWYDVVTFDVIWHCDLCYQDSQDTFVFLEHSPRSTH